MKPQSLALQNSIEELLAQFCNISDLAFSHKPFPEKWSGKEVLGHLIDSALNNIQRFIRCQYEQEPPRILYQQNEWVRLNNYQAAELQSLLQLWTLLNRQLVQIWEGMPQEALQKQVDVGTSQETISWLMSDYVAHLQHHGRQIGKVTKAHASH